MSRKKTENSSVPRKSGDSLINDPIYQVVGKMKVPVFWFTILVLYVAAYVTVGLIMDYLYPDVENMLRISDLAEIVNGINVWVIFVPIAWAYYRWLPENILMGIKEIEDQGMISNNIEDPITSQLRRRMSSVWVHILALVATLISFLYSLFVLIPSQEIMLNGLIDFWYYTTSAKIFYFILYLPANYAIFVFALRVLIAVTTLNSFFQHEDAIRKLYPLHPDRCGGMGNIGTLVTRTALFVALIPIWITIVSLYTLLAGGNSQFTATLIVYLVYLLLVPVVLIFPLWHPHRAMVRYKNNKLLAISMELFEFDDEFSKRHEDREWRTVKAKLERYKELEEIYKALEKNIPIWPISMHALRSFGAIAGSPVILGIFSNILMEYFLTNIF